jgi:hypothetical protein
VSELLDAALDDPGYELPPGDPPEAPETCQQPHCENPPQEGSKNCEGHKGKRAPKAADAPGPTLHIPEAPKVTRKDARAQEVAAGAETMLGLVVMGLGLTGDEVCTAAWAAAVPQIAAQLGELSKYHPGIAKLFVSAGGGGEGVVWIGLGFAVAPALLATLAHHHMLPEGLAVKIGGITAAVVADGAGAPT